MFGSRWQLYWIVFNFLCWIEASCDVLLAFETNLGYRYAISRLPLAPRWPSLSGISSWCEMWQIPSWVVWTADRSFSMIEFVRVGIEHNKPTYLKMFIYQLFRPVISQTCKLFLFKRWTTNSYEVSTVAFPFKPTGIYSNLLQTIQPPSMSIYLTFGRVNGISFLVWHQ